MKIKYELKKRKCITKCPRYNCLVGSNKCHSCIDFIYNDTNKQIVSCEY